ncbi:hypothetical protein AF72_08975 [Xylella taiwanensis]|uniref:Uncharacterized protein n=1 Tax=Xylella taiwanensis TaxID=1444770 RepID=Z9JJ56_9GAMM|nr:hypothetical protein AF72_08975 [Xylella taiwanensis]
MGTVAIPVTVLVVLCHASYRFHSCFQEIVVGIDLKVLASCWEAVIRWGSQGKAALYLPQEACGEYMMRLPQEVGVGRAFR